MESYPMCAPEDRSLIVYFPMLLVTDKQDRPRSSRMILKKDERIFLLSIRLDYWLST